MRLGRWSVSSGAVVAVLALVLAVVALFVVRVLWAERAVTLDPAPATATSPGGVVVSAPSTSPSGPTSSATQSPAVSLVVHVIGQVARPGLVRLATGARVADALTAAGGATRKADLAAVNLARPLLDGEQVQVPAPGETLTAPVPPQLAAGGAGPGGSAVGPTGQVDLNTADAAALDGLPGVGPVLAQRILDWRAAHGRFASVDELGEVSGIGDKLMAQLRDRVRV
ncbi:MAG: ComEA family DNA-binding protein [Terracoccus sp.]